MEDIVKMTITDDIEKSNFNPQMLKSCTDSSYQCGYQQGRVDAIDEFGNWLFENGYDSSSHNIKAWITEYNLRDKGAEQMSYWSNITKIYSRQRAKGIQEYGQTLEQNKSLTDIDRLEYLEEELVDALVYLEHLKAKLEDDGDDRK